jgi:hypothetical protein
VFSSKKYLKSKKNIKFAQTDIMEKKSPKKQPELPETGKILTKPRIFFGLTFIVFAGVLTLSFISYLMNYSWFSRHTSIVIVSSEEGVATSRKYWSRGRDYQHLSAPGSLKTHCIAAFLEHLLGDKQSLKTGGMLRYWDRADIVKGISGGRRTARQSP